MKTAQTLSVSTSTTEKPAAQEDHGPVRTRIGRLRESWARFISNTTLGSAIGHWASRTIALPQLKRLAVGEIPWAPLRKSITESTVVLVSTGGVHLRSDHPFNINGDSSFRVIPKDVRTAAFMLMVAGNRDTPYPGVVRIRNSSR